MTDSHPHYGKPGSTLPTETQERILQLCRDGVTRNDIVRQLGVGPSSVSGIVKRAGLSFDRTKIKAATEARTADLRSRRAELLELLLEDAHRLRQEAFEPCTAFNFGGKDNSYNEVELAQPMFADQLKIMQAVGVAVSKHIALDLHDADPDDKPAVDAWLEAMTGGDPSTPAP